jgi:hypothetical protein
MYVINKDKKYMNCSSLWYDADELRAKFEQEGIKICHKDYKCSGYLSDECNCKSKINKRKVNPNEIKYVFDGKFKFDNEMFSYYEVCNNDELCKIIKKLFQQIEDKNKINTISNIKFVLEKEIKITNNHGINKDHRGSDHMIIDLPFVSNIELGCEFTLEELIIACTNLKSHKFDNCYELYCDSKCEIADNQIVINACFDHGS